MRLPELEDQAWFPQWLRQMQLDFIGFVVCTFGVYKPVLPLLRQLLEKDGHHRLFDLCSGSGGPMVYFKRHLPEEVRIVLSDKYPQLATPLPHGLTYQAKPFDASKQALPTNGVLTMCNAFHHFSAVEKGIFLQKIAQNAQPVLVIEILTPSVLCALIILLTTTVGQLLTAPFVKPFSLRRLLCTYVIPINIITVAWDGLASVGKSLSAAQFHALCAQYSATSYRLTCYRLGSLFSPLYVLKGTPIKL
jgi:hypothetical protein